MARPQQIGKYKLLGILGRGAMGIVYKAFDLGIERIVALKVIHKNLLNDDSGQMMHTRFKREAQAAGRLMHPNIVSVFEYGQDDGFPFIAMEYVEGMDLSSLFKKQKTFNLRQAVGVINQVLNALGYSHAHGVIHRDIKPGNVILLKNGQIKVMDFGIARMESSELTQTGIIMGSPSYMSPEQVMGKRVDSRSDLFSAGVLFFELLTGERLFPGQGVTAILHKVLNEDPPSPSQLNSQVPATFDAVVGKALDKRPEARFQTAVQFKAAIAQAMRGEDNERKILSVLDAPIENTATATQLAFGGATTEPDGLLTRTGLTQGPSSTHPTFPDGVTSYPTMGGMTTIPTGMVRQSGPVYIPIPIDELPHGKGGVDLYLTFNNNFVLFRRRSLPIDESVFKQWQETGIERIFIKEADYPEFLSWVYRQERGISSPNAHLLYLQERFYQVDPSNFINGSTVSFPIYATEGRRIFPVVATDIPGLPNIIDRRRLAQFSQIFIHLRNLPSYFEMLTRLLEKDAKFFPINRKGATLTREKMKMAAHALFHSDKVGEAMEDARKMVVSMLDLIAGNPDTYYAMMAVSDLDSNTYIHSTNVSALSLGLGHILGFSREEMFDLGMGGLLHDIGKREIALDLLLKSTSISTQEYESLKEHVLLGVKFCWRHKEIPERVARIVAQHHERLDGSGYPFGLKEAEIDPLSQVVAIMEVYDSLTSKQPFRKAFTPFQALKKLRGFGDRLNQELVSHFIKQLGSQVKPEE